MQIRLTVALAPRGARSAADPGEGGGTGTAPSYPVTYTNVLVTAPAGTVLSAVTGALATSAAAALAATPGAPGGPANTGRQARAGGEDGPQESVTVYAGTRRLDPHRQIIGEPPLLDGALVSLHAPVAPAALPAHGAAVTALTAYGSARARLHVVAGPDAGGIHLLQGGKVLLGRSAEADVPLDDPDVSRLHCAVTVTDGGAVTVTDLDSTNGTTLDGAPVGGRPVLFRPGATLRLGETALRLEAAGPAGATGGAAQHAPPTPPLALPTTPDGEGRLRLSRDAGAAGPSSPVGSVPGAGAVPSAPVAGPGHEIRQIGGGVPQAAPGDAAGAHAYASGGPFPDSAGTHASGIVPPPPRDPRETGPRKGKGLGAWARRFAGGGRTEPEDGQGSGHGDGHGAGPALVSEPPYASGGAAGPGGDGTAAGAGLPDGPTRYGAGTADGLAHGGHGPLPGGAPAPRLAPHEWAARWPDPAAVLLSALGPGPRLWERGPAHPDALTVRLGTTWRSDGQGEPVTVDLRRAGSLGLAGPRARLTGLARAVVAQLTALHGPSALEVVLLAADRSRDVAERQQDWSWLGWLPHLRPTHGQDCGLLTAYDRDQAAARVAELVRRLDAQETAPTTPVAPPAPPASVASGAATDAYGAPAGSHGAGATGVLPYGAGGAPAIPGTPGAEAAHSPSGPYAPSGSHAPSVAQSPSGARPGEGTPGVPGAAGGPTGPTGPGAGPVHGVPAGAGGAGSRPAGRLVQGAVVVVVDGDPGSAALRADVARLAREGARAGIHLVCLAETPSASPTSPVAATVEAADDACPAFPECGTVALLSGDVATAVQVLHRTAAPGAGGGYNPAAPVATADGVSAAWAERFARALAPLREPDGAAERAGIARPTVTLPDQCRLLDELGLARATPAALLARWSAQLAAPAGRAPLVFGAGPHGPLEADLSDVAPRTAEDGSAPVPGHALISGGPGAGKTELLRSLAASLAAGERPDRLALVLIDGAGAGAGEGLRPCVELPHVTEHLVAGDPVRMRQFAQALSAEVKRRAELIGDELGYEEYVRLSARPGGRVVAPRQAPEHARGRSEAGHPGESGVQLPAQPSAASVPDERAAIPAGRAPQRAARTDAAAGGRGPGDGTYGDGTYGGGATAPGGGRSRTDGSGASGDRTPGDRMPSDRTSGDRTSADRAPGVGGRAPGGARGRAEAAWHQPGSGRGPDDGTRGASAVSRGPDDGGAGRAGHAAGGRPDHVRGRAAGSGGPGDGSWDAARGSWDPARGAWGPDEGDRAGADRAVRGPAAQVPRNPAGDARTAGGGARGTGAVPAQGAGDGRPAAERPGAERGPGQAERGGRGTAHPAGVEPDRTQRTLRLRQRDGERSGGPQEASAIPSPLGPDGVPPRLVVLVDDFDTLVDPALGNPGRPAAGSVVRALETVARSGARLGVHVVAATGRADRTAGTLLARTAALHAELTGGEGGEGGTPPGRGTLSPGGGGPAVPFQAGRVTGRIPRTATVRPTVVPLEWTRAGDPPARRQVRELGNGPTDLALLASAMERAAQQAARSR
ncbi:FtsK/SpoIIIE domain-containing protein [Streptomyces albus]|uniref:FHA domain-containing protein n=1 Tax=Streptomyces albus TaxID=1888 RepID=A0A8H1L457_9ACTN|nr:FtsK/SpoIIIE domain-containing protein [Streptomyces albus]TGG77254.1 FHA domain-containing protein [Streptomyces albus]UVN56556.1 FtsK/SpoIIIE domain-containing protein [Streptomyces albus]